MVEAHSVCVQEDEAVGEKQAQDIDFLEIIREVDWLSESDDQSKEPIGECDWAK